MNKERRVKFVNGKQRKFLADVLISLNCPSLRALNQYGFNIPYSTLKNYNNESRLLPESFFRDLCFISKIDPQVLKVSYLEANWGRVKGGRN